MPIIGTPCTAYRPILTARALGVRDVCAVCGRFGLDVQVPDATRATASTEKNRFDSFRPRPSDLRFRTMCASQRMRMETVTDHRLIHAQPRAVRYNGIITVL